MDDHTRRAPMVHVWRMAAFEHGVPPLGGPMSPPGFAIGALAIAGAFIVLETFAEVARLRRLARSERSSSLEEAHAASQPSSESHTQGV
jgi:hypothetical protein